MSTIIPFPSMLADEARRARATSEIDCDVATAPVSELLDAALLMVCRAQARLPEGSPLGYQLQAVEEHLTLAALDAYLSEVSDACD
jgi:hypothetical protein